MAVHARRALGFHVRRGVAPDKASWLDALKSGCPARPAAKRVCEQDLVDRYHEELPWVLDELYDDAEGDEAFLNLGEVSAKLCAHTSPTHACPPDVHAMRPVEENLEDAQRDVDRGVEIALRNLYSGPVEVHVIDLNTDTDCALSEQELLEKGTHDAVRFVDAGTETRFFLPFLGPDGEPVERPTLRVKPRGAYCGHGTDAHVEKGITHDPATRLPGGGKRRKSNRRRSSCLLAPGLLACLLRRPITGAMSVEESHGFAHAKLRPPGVLDTGREGACPTCGDPAL